MMPKTVATLEDAFNICREVNVPKVFIVDGQRVKCYPSGFMLKDVSRDLACTPVWVIEKRPSDSNQN